MVRKLRRPLWKCDVYGLVCIVRAKCDSTVGVRDSCQPFDRGAGRPSGGYCLSQAISTRDATVCWREYVGMMDATMCAEACWEVFASQHRIAGSRRLGTTVLGVATIEYDVDGRQIRGGFVSATLDDVTGTARRVNSGEGGGQIATRRERRWGGDEFVLECIGGQRGQMSWCVWFGGRSAWVGLGGRPFSCHVGRAVWARLRVGVRLRLRAFSRENGNPSHYRSYSGRFQSRSRV